MRESGFYWVKIHDDYGWEVAKYDSESNEWLCFESEYFVDEELQEIDEKMIVKS